MKRADMTYTKERVLALIENEYESDAAFEREMGLPPKTVNNWRRGRSSSFMRMLPRFAEDFDISLGELLDVPIQKDTSELSEDELRLLSLYRKSCALSPKQRIALLRSLESVIELYLESAPDKTAKKSRAGKN
jgi:transcriptional regulator with XRE-family HTH domain